MFVRNKTSLKVGLARGRLSDEGSAGALVVCSTYSVSGGTLAPREAPPLVPSDPPDLTREALWAGTSVTAVGDVHGPLAAPFLRTVSLMVGETIRRLTVFGERSWEPGRAGELVPSAPRPFARLAMSFLRAYGGHVDLPPGLFPGTDLPYPGGRLTSPMNRSGLGFYLDKAGASGRPLPNFELADQLIRQWSDRPVPGCFAPCPDLAALRLAPPAPVQSPEEWVPRDPDAMFSLMLRAKHHAPGYLVFDDVPPGTPVHLEGVGREVVRFLVPPPPARVSLRRAAGRRELRPELRSLHIDEGRAVVSCVHGYPFVYRRGEEPSWVLVEN
jgi:hypothetical protein